MQDITDRFLAKSRQDMRPLAWGCWMSFEKQFDDDITFFTIESSLIAGTDFIKASSSEVVQEWDKYAYSDFSDRVIDISITRQVETLESITTAMADIVLNNYDDYFTPGKGSEIDEYILPSRPIRLYMGFGDERIPMFIGITDGMPVIDEKEKTATFHCIDYMSTLMARPLSESVLFTSDRTSEILETLFDLAGISSSQLDLDEGFNIVPYAYFKKDSKLGSAVEKLMQVERGRIFMNEKGVIMFKNRQNYESDSVYNFDAYNNINDIVDQTLDDLINVVEIKGKIREEQAKQKYWELNYPVLVPAGESINLWADFEDPVTSVDDPVYITNATTSLFTVNTMIDSGGDNNSTDVTLTSGSMFAESFKMVFANSGNTDLYITTLELFATPAKVTAEIYIREQDDSSVTAYDEQIYSIENDFFQGEDDARSVALAILRDYANYGGIRKLDVKGCFAIQLDDPIQVDIFDNIENYKVIKIIDRISQPARYTQILTLKKYTPTDYFIIEESLIGGDHLIHP